MRRFVALFIAATTVSCTNPEKMTEQFVPPAPTPPPMHAPICAHPSEKAAVDVSALVSELQLVTMICHTKDKYNALIPHLRPALATKEKNLTAFFKRAYGKRSQIEHDKYITELANLQSESALKSGDRFCNSNAGIFDQVMPLSTVEQLAAYAERKAVQQAMAVRECTAFPTAKATSRKKVQQTASG